MGDFIGFTFGGYHSFDDLNIIRVSGGDRYEEELQSEIKDRTAEVSGLNGEYYFGSDYGSRKINVEIAFDSLTEEQFRNLRRVFGTKRTQELIFDERPYKKYMAKIESPIELSYICFDEPKKTIGAERDGVRRITRIEEEPVIDEETDEPVIDEETGEPITESVVYRDLEQVTPYELQEGTMRIYKGEGKISFVCYFPFAKSVYKKLPNEEEESSWAISSGILSADEYADFDTYDSETGTIKVYNGGDLDTGFRLYVPAAVAVNGLTLNYKPDGSNTTASLVINPITLKSDRNNIEDMGVLIDTTSEIILGVSQITIDSIITTSGNIYNEYIEAGYFFHLEPNLRSDNAILEVEGGAQGIEIFYDYLYF